MCERCENCKRVADLEEAVRASNERATKAELDMFRALDRDETISILRSTLHEQDDNVKRLERELAAALRTTNSGRDWMTGMATR
jgi:predicted RNase H-like nuclease (RuvC/YqgF family)